MGNAIGFSPEGRPVRVWVRGMPGGDETEVVPGTITEVRDGGAVLYLRSPDRWLYVVPHEAGWGLQALWFSFISVDVFELDGGERGEALGRWFIRLGTPSGAG